MKAEEWIAMLRRDWHAGLADEAAQVLTLAQQEARAAALRDAKREIEAEAKLWDGDCAEPFPNLRKRIRALLEGK